jgi:hypothetical protein
VDESERRRHLQTLAATPAALKGAVRGLPKKVVRFTPAPGKWSILEILVHLRDMEREAYLERYERILAEIEPRLPDLNGEAFAIERDYRSGKAAEVLRDWNRLRRETLRLLRKVTPAQWTRAGVHESAGRLTMEDFLRRQAVGNDEAHLGQIEAIKRRYTILETLAGAPAAMAAALKGASDEALRRRPAAGKWSMIENAAHLRDIERVYQGRFSKMAFSDRPAFWMLDNDRAAAALRYGESAPAAVVKEFRRLREETLALLRALPHQAWRRTGLHPTRGELTVEQLAGVLAGHDERHLEKIRSLRG